MIIKRMLLAIGTIVLSAHCAFAACATKDVIFADEFNDAMGGWTQGTGIAIGDGIATLSVRKGFGTKTVLNNGFAVRDGHICVVAAYPTHEQSRNADTPTMGIVFGATDYSHYYAFEVTASGAYTLVRYNNDNWIQVIDWTNTPALKRGFGAENQIEVTIDKSIVSMFINEQKVNASRVQLPDGESQFGLLAALSTSPDMDAPFQFRNFVVSRVGLAFATPALASGIDGRWDCRYGAKTVADISINGTGYVLDTPGGEHGSGSFAFAPGGTAFTLDGYLAAKLHVVGGNLRRTMMNNPELRFLIAGGDEILCSSGN